MLPLPLWFLRCAVLYLVLGTGLGSYFIFQRMWGSGYYPPGLTTVHGHLLSIGTFLFMIIGVSLWMFPRPPGVDMKDAQRDPFGWAAFGLLNVGLVLRALTEPWATPGALTGHLFGVSGVLLILGIVSYAFAIWKRIRGPRAGR